MSQSRNETTEKNNLHDYALMKVFFSFPTQCSLNAS